MFNSILTGLNNSSRDILASGVLLSDGFPVATFPPLSFNADIIGGISAALMHYGRLAATEMLGGGPDWVCVKSSEGGLLIARAGVDKLLVARIGPSADTMPIIPEFERAADRVRALGVSDGKAYARNLKAASAGDAQASASPWRAGLAAELDHRRALRGGAIAALLAARCDRPNLDK
ncbi:roadblock/LC7 domain-containing protein [Methylomagnum sp.]